MPRKNWPSRKAKAKAYKYGKSYSWRVITFNSSHLECRVRILLNEQKQIFRASLGVTENGDTKMLCEYEFHASEPGWHCHARCENISEIDANRTRYGAIRIPMAKSKHRRLDFTFRGQLLSKVTAFNCTIQFFKIEERGGLI